MPKRQPDPPQTGDCGPIARERNRYYTGRYLTARDFADEQRYFLSRHRLHNRLFHGWGIVCGLSVGEHPDEGCRDRWVVVASGIAIDCCGRELILPRDTAFKLPLPGPEGRGPCVVVGCKEESPEEPTYTEPFFLCLRYREEEIERVPVLYGECCDEDRTEANRIAECPEIVVCRAEEICWGTGDAPADRGCRDDCDGGDDPETGGCIVADCRCGRLVPLARIVPQPGQTPPFTIELDGRRELGATATSLTHVVETSWPHGGQVSLRQLRESHGRLWVRFDRKLAEADGEKTGINEHTFVVQYVGAQRDLEFLEYAADFPPGLNPENHCEAVFTIDPSALGAKPGTFSIAEHMIYVTLRCDLIPDCRGRAVDGNHLRGTLPSGDGVEGGTFESWFRVTYDDAERRAAGD
jgi:hypothetical protein